MKSDTPLDYAVFQLSPSCSRCELFVFGEGNTEKLASGLLRPFVTHLKVVEEQLAHAVQSIKLEVDKRKNSGTWFTKGTLERFVRFVSTPEILELVNTFDAEVSQLEVSQRIYSQGAGDQLSRALSGDERGAAAAADVTKKELLRAIDVRLVAVMQDLSMACARASAAGFTPDTVSELLLFAEQFGAHRLNEACNEYISLSHRRPGLINTWKGGGNDRSLRSSSGSDMSIDDPTKENIPVGLNGPHQPEHQHQQETSKEPDTTQQHLKQSKPSTCDQFKSSTIFQIRRSLRESSSERDKDRENGAFENEEEESVTKSSQTSHPSRRLSVQDRINLFENKQKEQSGSGGKVVVGKSAELRMLPSVVSSAPQVIEKAVLRRWSGTSDMSIELSMETESSSCTPCSSSNSQPLSEDKDLRGLKSTATSSKAEFRGLPGGVETSGLKDRAVSQTWVGCFSGREEDVGSKDQTDSETRLRVLSSRLEVVRLRDQSVSRPQLTPFSGRADNVGRKDQMSSEAQLKSFLDRAEDVDLKNKAASQTRFRSFSGGAEEVGLIDQAASQTLFKTSSNGAEHAGVKDQVASQLQNRGLPDQVEVVGLADRAVPRTHSGSSSSRVDDVGSEDEPSHVPPREFLNSMEDVGLRDQLTTRLLFRASQNTAVKITSNSKDPLASQIQSKAVSGKSEGSIGVKDCGVSQAEYKGFEAQKLGPQSQGKSFPGEVKVVTKKGDVLSETRSGSFPIKVEDSGLQGMKLQRQISAPEQSKKVQNRRGKSDLVYGSRDPLFLGRKVTENQIFGSVVTAPVEQVRKVKQSKGNQELNDELQMKANELEKLFAAHKLRVPGDQSGSARRSKTTDMQEQVACFSHRKPAEVTCIQLPDKNTVGGLYRSSSNVAEFDVNSLIKMVDNQDHGNSLKQNISELCCSEDSRGKFYDRYMQKREAKLREEWGSKRAQKEAKMKAMHESLERSKAELMAKFAGSADRHNWALQAPQRARNLRSFSVHSTMKNREQQPIESVESEEDGDLSEFPEQTLFKPQKPILVANFPHNQSGKGVTKGFKRLLKLGSKSHGRESLVDWISATTSEGDEDTEDGQDLANRSVGDLRKSKIGFSQGHPYDGFNEGELFNEQDLPLPDLATDFAGSQISSCRINLQSPDHRHHLLLKIFIGSLKSLVWSQLLFPVRIPSVILLACDLPKQKEMSQSPYDYHNYKKLRARAFGISGKGNKSSDDYHNYKKFRAWNIR
ncbi:hypothetical protein HHK36_021918 [Tetracentron sinense]|uniref:COP1-interacting protein 7 n=1 Tax=Tetracentron sinense TaxID=13715 RepID=A0A834YSI7_TETSI|nr:hypothetical protein HHK36_021918 [Tetracentron sinense]